MEIELKITKILPEDVGKPKLLQKRLIAYVNIHGDKDLVDAIRAELETRSAFWEIV